MIQKLTQIIICKDPINYIIYRRILHIAEDVVDINLLLIRELSCLISVYVKISML